MTPVRTKKDIIQRIKSNKRDISRLGTQRLGLFGSFLSGKPTHRSDVDLIVEFKPAQKKYDNFIKLAFLLEDIFNRKVELVTKNSISPYLREGILNSVEYVQIS
ncbi:nucleotidyltransferase domain-containing protein [Candidatus Uhrbacteria bacterium]|nr:nucleotidyltransferase domain-containing protein [Candidatus Uhrbacteria bacterium]